MDVLESAFASWGSYVYHDEWQISMLKEKFLSAGYERKYVKPDTFMREEQDYKKFICKAT